MRGTWLTIVVVTASFATSICDAAEIQLRRQAAPATAVVTLGDIADVTCGDTGEAAELRSIELFPAPLPGERRFVRLREVQDALEVSGVRMARLTFSGSSQISIESPKAEAPTPAPRTRAAPLVDTGRLRRAIRDAVIEHLQSRGGAKQGWSVDLNLTREQLLTLNGATGAFAASGGESPWTGAQEFKVAFETADGPGELSVSSQVSLPPEVVVAVRALPRGSMIHESDIELRPAPVGSSEEGYSTVEEVVGMEATAAIHAGQVLGSDSVRAPLLVRRGEVVTVYARSAGIRVRTTARARDNGSQGELITVESLADRKTYYARVCGVQEVEVFARPAQAKEKRDEQ